MYNIVLLYGSVRSHRQGIKAARFAEKAARNKGWEVTFIDPMEYQLPLLNKMYKEMEKPAPVFKELHEILEAADGYLIVTGEYNHSVPPALKNLLDHFQSEYLFKPSGIISYSAGSFGGVRAAVHLRVICAELGMPSISSILPVPKVGDSFDEEGNPHDEAYHKRMERFMGEFEFYVEALKNQRAKGKPF